MWHRDSKYYICFKYGRGCLEPLWRGFHAVFCCRTTSVFCDAGRLPVQRIQRSLAFLFFLSFLLPSPAPTLWFLPGEEGVLNLKHSHGTPSLFSFKKRQALSDNNYKIRSRICKLNMHKNILASTATFVLN